MSIRIIIVLLLFSTCPIFANVDVDIMIKANKESLNFSKKILALKRKIYFLIII